MSINDGHALKGEMWNPQRSSLCKRSTTLPSSRSLSRAPRRKHAHGSASNGLYNLSSLPRAWYTIRECLSVCLSTYLSMSRVEMLCPRSSHPRVTLKFGSTLFLRTTYKDEFWTFGVLRRVIFSANLLWALMIIFAPVSLWFTYIGRVID